MNNARIDAPDILHARPREDTRDIERLAQLLDAQWVIPGTNWRFGLDAIIGLVPGVGDALAAALGGYIILRARELGAPAHLLARMALNLGIDTVIGAVPVLGDAFDVAFRANVRNVRLLLRHLEKREARLSGARR